LNSSGFCSAVLPAACCVVNGAYTAANPSLLAACLQAIAYRQESLEEPEQQEEKEELPSFPSGFGSPVKYSESPAMSVSIAGAISERSGMEGVEEEAEGEEDEEVCSGTPAGEQG